MIVSSHVDCLAYVEISDEQTFEDGDVERTIGISRGNYGVRSRPDTYAATASKPAAGREKSGQRSRNRLPCRRRSQHYDLGQSFRPSCVGLRRHSERGQHLLLEKRVRSGSQLAASSDNR